MSNGKVALNVNVTQFSRPLENDSSPFYLVLVNLGGNQDNVTKIAQVTYILRFHIRMISLPNGALPLSIAHEIKIISAISNRCGGSSNRNNRSDRTSQDIWLVVLVTFVVT